MADATRDELIKAYFDLGFKDKEIQFLLYREHSILVSKRQLIRIRQQYGWSNRAYSDPSLVVEFVIGQLKLSGQLHGYRIMHAKCRQSGLRVRLEDIRSLLRQLDPQGVDQRLRRRLSRRAYFADGPNFVWHVDGYDKLKPFGLPIHGCIDGFSREVIWLNVYSTNNNPKVVGGYFVEAIEQCEGCPRIVRADYGTENGYVRDIQMFLRREGQDSQSTRCYIEGSSTSNQRMEAWWSFLRKECIQFWIDHFRGLSETGDFGGDQLDKGLVQFCFTGLLQKELDTISEVWNDHPIRPSRNRRVPSGRPRLMYHVPGLWRTEDKLCSVSTDDIMSCRNECQFRSPIPCEVNLYDACIRILQRDELVPPTSADDATDLYLFLRSELRY